MSLNLKPLFFMTFDSKMNQKLILDEIKGRFKAVSELKFCDKKDNKFQTLYAILMGYCPVKFGPQRYTNRGN